MEVGELLEPTKIVKEVCAILGKVNDWMGHPKKESTNKWMGRRKCIGGFFNCTPLYNWLLPMLPLPLCLLLVVP